MLASWSLLFVLVFSPAIWLGDPSRRWWMRFNGIPSPLRHTLEPEDFTMVALSLGAVGITKNTLKVSVTLERCQHFFAKQI
jgi:hypothetical protein